MTGPWLARRAAGALLLAGAALSFVSEGGWLARPVAPALQALPARLPGGLAIGEPIPFDLAALGEQPPESHAYRTVHDPQGHEGRLFLAFYERAKRWSGRPHDLEGCYAAAGWSEVGAVRLEGAPYPWIRTFARAGARVRVVHWIDVPGAEPAPGARGFVTRLLGSSGLRRDVVSVYVEFPLEDAPDEAGLAAVARDVSQALEDLW